MAASSGTPTVWTVSQSAVFQQAADHTGDGLDQSRLEHGQLLDSDPMDIYHWP